MRLGRKPPPGVQPARDLAHRMIGLWLFNEGMPPRNLAGVDQGDPVGSFNGSTPGYDRFGEGVVHDVLGDDTTLIPSGSLPLQGVTVCVGFNRYSNETSSLRGLFGVVYGAGLTGQAFGVRVTDTILDWNFGGLTEDTTKEQATASLVGYHAWAFTTGARGMEIWQDGQLLTSNASNPTRSANSTLYLGQEGQTGGTPTDSPLGTYYWMMIHRDQLAVDQLVAIMRDPYGTLCEWRTSGVTVFGYRNDQGLPGGRHWKQPHWEVHHWKDQHWLGEEGADTTVGGGGTTYEQAVSDTVAFTEALIRQAQRNVAESVALTESLIRQAQRTIAETVDLQESLVALKIVLQSVDDTVTLTETLTRQTNRDVSETVALTEALKRDVTHLLADQVGLTEVRIRETQRTISETVSLSEALDTLKVVLKDVDDTIALSETLTLTSGKSIAETVSLVEVLALQTQKAIAETVGLTETNAQQVQRAIAETLGLSEALQASKTQLKNIAETVSLAENFDAVIPNARLFTEAVSLVDALARHVERLIGGSAETITFTEKLFVARRSLSVAGSIVGGPRTFHTVLTAKNGTQIEAHTNDELPFPIFRNNEAGDQWYIAQENKFSQAEFVLDRKLAAPASYLVEYFNGTTWLPVPLASDETQGFTQNGLLRWFISDLVGWAPIQINPLGYFLRGTLLSTITSDPPTAADVNPATQDIISGKWRSGDGLIINRVIFDTDWDWEVQQFLRHVIFTFDDSVKTYGVRPAMRIPARGIQGAPSMLEQRAATIAERFADPPAVLDLDLFYSQHMYEPGDRVIVTIPWLPNLVTGARGIEGEVFEVINVMPSFAPQGKVTVTLLDVEAITATTPSMSFFSPENEADLTIDRDAEVDGAATQQTDLVDGGGAAVALI